MARFQDFSQSQVCSVSPALRKPWQIDSTECGNITLDERVLCTPVVLCKLTYLPFAVVCTCGATSCYLLSKLVGKSIALKIWPGKIQEFAKEVDKRRGDMLSYIIFLRVTPILPNTFINVVSPIVGVPLAPFVTGLPDSTPCTTLHCSTIFCSILRPWEPNHMDDTYDNFLVVMLSSW